MGETGNRRVLSETLCLSGEEYFPASLCDARQAMYEKFFCVSASLREKLFYQ
jgi:hypothetical protein